MIGSSSSKIASSRYIATTVLTYEGINNKSPKDEWLVSASEVGEREISFVLWEVGIAGSWRFRRTRTEFEVEFVFPVWLGRITSP